MSGNWCLIESDPGVFTELIETFGVKGVEVTEVLSLDAEELRKLGPVFGLVFLFDVAKERNRQGPEPIKHVVSDLFFAKQMINNACATQAILNILLNATGDLELGTMLENFKEFTLPLDPESRGIAMTNADELRSAHNSFSRQETFTMEEARPKKEDELYHFVAYVPHNGRLYELDGIRSAPIDHGEIGDRPWTDKASEVLMHRVSQYSPTDIKFNLMALVQDLRTTLQDTLDEEMALLMSLGAITDPDTSLDEIDGSSLDDTGRAALARARDAKQQLQQEEEKRKRWRAENERRKHNYIPLYMQLLRDLAKTGKLRSLMDAAKTKHAQRMREYQQKAMQQFGKK